VITLYSHSLYSKDRIIINGVLGTTELNGNTYWINRLDADTFELYSDPELTVPVDGTGYGVYVSSGTVDKFNISGALTVIGGAGIKRNMYVGESLHAGVAGAPSYFYGDVLPVGNVNLGSNDNKFNSLYLAGSTLYLGTVTLKSPDSLSFDIESSEGYVRQTVGDITLTSGLNATNTSSGSVIVQGGVGIAKDVWIGGDLYVTGEINAAITGVSTSTINLEGGDTGSLVYQQEPNATTFLPIGETGKVLLSNGSTPYWGDASGSANTDNIFVNTATDELYYLGLTKQIGTYSPIDSDQPLTYNRVSGSLSAQRLVLTSSLSSSTTTTNQSLEVAGGIGVKKDSYFAEGIYGRDGNPDEMNLLYTPKVTVSLTAPLSPKVGDIWISASAYLQYIKDGTNKFWIQVGTV
jgi:hypothetical protein